MTDEQPLSAEQIAAEAAWLAEHLHRCGVQFLPKPNPEAVAALRSRLRPAGPPPESESSAAPVVPQATPARPHRLRADASEGPLRPAASPAPAESFATPYPGDDLPVIERQARLDEMAEQVAGCTRCPELVRCRTQTVFGEGHPSPRVVFFGEGPGADEDRSGRPFVGRAGQLLTKMIEACSFQREEVYILNTVKCRPPNNRNPEPSEIENCRQYFETQLSILRPEYIICLGAVSSRALLNSKLSVGRLRGKMHRYFESKVVVTYHPAYLLRTPAAKKAAWEDLQLMLRDAGIAPKTR